MSLLHTGGRKAFWFSAIQFSTFTLKVTLLIFATDWLFLFGCSMKPLQPVCCLDLIKQSDWYWKSKIQKWEVFHFWEGWKVDVICNTVLSCSDSLSFGTLTKWSLLMKEWTDWTQLHAVLLCLYEVDPASLLASNSVLLTVFSSESSFFIQLLR